MAILTEDTEFNYHEGTITLSPNGTAWYYECGMLPANVRMTDIEVLEALEYLNVEYVLEDSVINRLKRNRVNRSKKTNTVYRFQ